MRVREPVLHDLARLKLTAAGLSGEHASIVADVLVFADAYGIHSHGVMRVGVLRGADQQGRDQHPAELLGGEDRAVYGALPR